MIKVKNGRENMVITGLPYGVTIHNLKILPEYYWKVETGEKTFEIRRNDRDFKVGDVICLSCWTEEIGFHDLPVLYASVLYITSYEQKENYVVMSIALWAKR